MVNTPTYLSWVPSISLIRWAYEALCVNEFTDLPLVPASKSGPLSVKNGLEVLQSMKMGESTVEKALKAQFLIIAFNYAFTYLSLWKQRPSFEKVQDNVGGGDDDKEISTKKRNKRSNKGLNRKSNLEDLEMEGSDGGGGKGKIVVASSDVESSYDKLDVATNKEESEDAFTDNQSSVELKEREDKAPPHTHVGWRNLFLSSHHARTTTIPSKPPMF